MSAGDSDDFCFVLCWIGFKRGEECIDAELGFCHAIQLLLVHERAQFFMPSSGRSPPLMAIAPP